MLVDAFPGDAAGMVDIVFLVEEPLRGNMSSGAIVVNEQVAALLAAAAGKDR